MKHTILTVGKKHEAWVEPGILRFCERLRAPFAVEVVHSPKFVERTRWSDPGRV